MRRVGGLFKSDIILQIFDLLIERKVARFYQTKKVALYRLHGMFCYGKNKLRAFLLLTIKINSNSNTKQLMVETQVVEYSKVSLFKIRALMKRSK